MSDAYQTQTVSRPETQVQQQPSSGGGKCLLFGCLGATLLLLLVCGGGIFGSIYFVKSQVAKYTSDTRADIPVVELTDEQVAEIKSRTTAFKETVESGGTPEPLVLTADEINGMIASEEELSGRIHIKIEDGNVTGDVSFPADPFPGGEGRYFNASGTFDVSINNGYLDVRLVEATVKGDPLPNEVVEALRQENLAKDVGRNNPEAAKFIAAMESLSVEGDKIILTPRVQSDSDKSLEAVTDGVSEAESNDDNSEAPGATEPTASSNPVDTN